MTVIKKKPAFSLLLLCTSLLLAVLCSYRYKARAATEKPAQPDSTLIDRILAKDPSHFGRVLSNPQKFKVQIIYTQIDRDLNNAATFREFTYRVKPDNYFYCASLVKLPCAALALEKLNELGINGLNSKSRMMTDSLGPCQKRTYTDTSSENGYPSVDQYIRRMLLISDNIAYSRIYEFLGPEYIFNKLRAKGYPDAFIIQRFDPGCNTEDNTVTNPIHFTDQAGTVLYEQKAVLYHSDRAHPLGKPVAGHAYIDGKGKKVNEPRDFSHSNYLSLPDITTMLRSILFPTSVNAEKRFKLKDEDRHFMLRYLSMLPREATHPRYNSKDYYDSYKKYLIYGNNRDTLGSDSLRIFNIVGQSYGFMTDVAYVCDFKNKIEFMLSAVIYTNENEVINDNKYEYNTIALPWFSELGKAIYEYDRKRKREHSPDLNEFRFTY
ncbi:MAG TPA: serine hydrolase [Bacteroidia bacterium]|jgi:hypothetical protein|nr:serine hydrolase [Bacteroidia bacterium]